MKWRPRRCWRPFRIHSRKAGSRLENNELRGRIRRLEDQLEEARMLALTCQTTHANVLYPQSRSLDSRSRANCLIQRRSTRQTTLPLLGRTSARSPCRRSTRRRRHTISSSKAQNQLKRISTTSSIFPVPPSNTAMLMAEELGATLSSRSVSPPPGIRWPYASVALVARGMCVNGRCPLLGMSGRSR